MLMRTDRAMVIVGAELSDVSLVDFDRHLIRDFSPGTRAHTAAAAAAAAAACHISAFVCLILNRYGTNMKKVVVCTELIYPLLYCVNEILYRVQRQALILLHSHCSAFFRTYVHSTYAYYAAPDRGAEYCDDRVCLCSSVCLSTSISPDYMSDLHQIFGHVTYVCGSPCLATLRYVMYFRFCGWRHVCTQWPGIGVAVVTQ